MYVYTTTTKIVFLMVIKHFLLFCRLSFLYDFKGVFDMVEKKTDRRILKTKRALRESLLYLLKEQPIQKISVSRLCEKSDINRSTFYTYYLIFVFTLQISVLKYTPYRTLHFTVLYEVYDILYFRLFR